MGGLVLAHRPNNNLIEVTILSKLVLVGAERGIETRTTKVMIGARNHLHREVEATPGGTGPASKDRGEETALTAADARLDESRKS
jgi:hypothetical protein